jgi:hypothetical protein
MRPRLQVESTPEDYFLTEVALTQYFSYHEAVAAE